MSFLKKLFTVSCFMMLSTNANAILNGEDAKPEDFLFHANIHNGKEDSHTCGATILNDRFILTAHHCVNGASESQMKVLVNVFDDRKIEVNEYKEVKAIHKHEDYLEEHKANGFLVALGFEEEQTDYLLFDIAVVELKYPIKDNVKSVTFGNYSKDKQIFAIGKGAIEDSNQKTLEAQYGSQYDIEHLLRPSSSKNKLRVAELNHDIEGKHCESDLLVCTHNYNKEKDKYTSVGYGDSGGALLTYNPETKEYHQIGVASYIRSIYNTEKSYSAFAATEQFMDFIEPFIKQGNPLVYDPSKGHNGFVSVGDGKTKEEAEAYFKDIIIQENRKGFLIFISVLLSVVSVCCAMIAHGKKIERKRKKERDEEKQNYTLHNSGISLGESDYKDFEYSEKVHSF